MPKCKEISEDKNKSQTGLVQQLRIISQQATYGIGIRKAIPVIPFQRFLKVMIIKTISPVSPGKFFEIRKPLLWGTFAQLNRIEKILFGF